MVESEIQWPVLAMAECGHFKVYPVDDAPQPGQMIRCEDCLYPRDVVAVGKVVGVRDEAVPFPQVERERLLAEATAHLLSDHDCDHHGWEVWQHALEASEGNAYG